MITRAVLYNLACFVHDFCNGPVQFLCLCSVIELRTKLGTSLGQNWGQAWDMPRFFRFPYMLFIYDFPFSAKVWSYPPQHTLVLQFLQLPLDTVRRDTTKLGKFCPANRRLIFNGFNYPLGSCLGSCLGSQRCFSQRFIFAIV